MNKLFNFLTFSLFALIMMVCLFMAFNVKMDRDTVSKGNKNNAKETFALESTSGKDSLNSSNISSTVNKNEVANIGDLSNQIVADANEVIQKTVAKKDIVIDSEKSQQVGDLRSDYKPVTGNGKTITEDNRSQDEVVGVTETYDFPEKMYPYRAMLNDNCKYVYDQVYESVLAVKDEVILARTVDSSNIRNVMMALYNDHPEVFWVDTEYTFEYLSSGSVTRVFLSYNETADALQSSRTKFLNAASEIINEASKYATDEEREKCVYDMIQERMKYNENAKLNQSAYSALVYGETVCAGYARAFQYIMQQLNIPCYFCSGYANGGSHAWNIVCIDGKFTNVDISWDDTIGDREDGYSYRFYNKTDSEMKEHIRRDLSVGLPKCN